MYVIGTAGHVDHGKSALVEALTGVHPDRLKEEREREMTIDLGFGWFAFENGEEVGVIDVPGHRDFIENMLAGVGGIDAALFVVAADEGVMPQTREHLAILDLLAIPGGVIALTKCDLVDDEWLALIKADVQAVVGPTALGDAPIVAVSAHTGAGLPELRQALQAVLAARPERADHGMPRLPIDRVFSLAGFGTVVTGTLTGGSMSVGEEVTLLPAQAGARIRGLQTHKNKLNMAQPGSRVAANIAGVELAQVKRGMVLARPGTLRPTRLFDARLRHLDDAAIALKHNAQIKLFVGAAEVLGIVRLLESDTLAPGQPAWVQIATLEPVCVARGDRFILRRPSPGETIAGGQVVDEHPRGRHRRKELAVIERLKTMARGTPGDLLRTALDALGPASLAAALSRAGLAGESATAAVAELRQTQQLIELDGEQVVMSAGVWRKFAADLDAILSAYHTSQRLRRGMPREEFKSKLLQRMGAGQRGAWTPRVFNGALARAIVLGLAGADGALVHLARHTVALTPSETALVEAVLADFRRDPGNTPSVKDCISRLGDDLYAALVVQGQLVPVSGDVVFEANGYQRMIDHVRQHLASHGKLTVAEARDMFATSRKYALALLEHMDAQGITRRVGDERVLKA